MVAIAPEPAAVPDEDDQLDLWNAGPPRKAPPPPRSTGSSSTSSDESIDNDNKDSAAYRAREAADKLHDHNASIAPTITLPSVDAAFTAVEGPPAFLDPEATRQIQELPRRNNEAPLSWDISRMAPKSKGSAEDDQPQAKVISAAAKRFKAVDGGFKAQQLPPVVSAAQGAMLGGPSQREERRDRGNTRSSKAMCVEEFLGKGVGGAQLPRKRQERKDKEKEQRGKGQSSHSHWKSEAEMALRQQYD
ncbi:hypothetical protein NADE_005680 [Nannochloris sp. 'desiccata']|nr:hypothetical protein NADE_005680 [Chlorella desiccata (nom. nud.)]